MATRLLAIGMDIADIQKFLGHADISATRIYAETSIAMLRRKFDRVTDPDGRDLLGTVPDRHGEAIVAFATDLLMHKPGVVRYDGKPKAIMIAGHYT